MGLNESGKKLLRMNDNTVTLSDAFFMLGKIYGTFHLEIFHTVFKYPFIYHTVSFFENNSQPLRNKPAHILTQHMGRAELSS